LPQRVLKRIIFATANKNFIIFIINYFRAEAGKSAMTFGNKHSL